MSHATHKNRLTNLLPGSLAEVDSLFNQFFSQTAPQGSVAGWRTPASLWEAEDRLHLEVDAPGVKKEDVEVTFEKGVLSIVVERRREEDRQYWHNERGFGKVTRTLALPDTVDPDSIEAELTDGVLQVSIAKLPEVQPRKIELR